MKVPVFRIAESGHPVFSTLIRLVTGAESDRSHIRHADGEPGCHEDLCGELSERLSGTGECGGDSSEKEKSNGASGDYEGERRGNFLYCRTEIRLLYDKSNPCNFYGNLKTLERRVGL